MYEDDPNAIKFISLGSDGTLKWEPVQGVTRYDVQIDEYKTISYTPEIKLVAVGTGTAHLVSNHTKVIVSAGERSLVLYANRNSDNQFSISTKEAPLLQTPNGFTIVEEEGIYFLQFNRVANDAPTNRQPAYLLYYWDQSKVD